MRRWMSPIVVTVASVIPPAFLICNLVSRRARVRPVTVPTYKPCIRAAPPVTVSRLQAVPLRTETGLTQSTMCWASVQLARTVTPATVAQTIMMAARKSVFCPALTMRVAARQASTAAPAPTPVVTAARPLRPGQAARSMSTRNVPPAMLPGQRSTIVILLVTIISI